MGELQVHSLSIVPVFDVLPLFFFFLGFGYLLGGRTPRNTIRLGTRGSRLALAQARETRDRLKAGNPELNVEIHTFSTKGDRLLDGHLMELGGKGLFTQELEGALLDGRIDLGVHSMKDVPTQLCPGTQMVAYLPREQVEDRLILGQPQGQELTGEQVLANLPAGAVIGTASLRRRAQVLQENSRLTCKTIRGNLDTRLKKLKTHEYAATLLAQAGLNRLGEPLESHSLSFLPAIAQGCIGLQSREGDPFIQDQVASLNHWPTQVEVECERAFLRALDGSCRTPIAGLARLNLETLELNFMGRLYSVDGSTSQGAQQTLKAEYWEVRRLAATMGTALGLEVRARLGSSFFEEQTQLLENMMAQGLL